MHLTRYVWRKPKTYYLFNYYNTKLIVGKCNNFLYNLLYWNNNKYVCEINDFSDSRKCSKNNANNVYRRSWTISNLAKITFTGHIFFLTVMHIDHYKRIRIRKLILQLVFSKYKDSTPPLYLLTKTSNSNCNITKKCTSFLEHLWLFIILINEKI